MHDISQQSMFSLLYLIIFGSVIAFTAYLWLLTITLATRVSTYAFVNPVIAVILGWLFAEEPLTLSTVIATAIIVLSVYLVLTERSRYHT
jgi:drug/metabolite transporter (DMT)-like permease